MENLQAALQGRLQGVYATAHARIAGRPHSQVSDRTLVNGEHLPVVAMEFTAEQEAEYRELVSRH